MPVWPVGTRIFWSLICRDGLKPTPEKIRAISQFSKPQTIVELHKFLEMENFFRRSLPHATDSQAVLHQYLHDNDKRKIF